MRFAVLVFFALLLPVQVCAQQARHELPRGLEEAIVRMLIQELRGPLAGVDSLTLDVEVLSTRTARRLRAEVAKRHAPLLANSSTAWRFYLRVGPVRVVDDSAYVEIRYGTRSPCPAGSHPSSPWAGESYGRSFRFHRAGRAWDLANKKELLRGWTACLVPPRQPPPA